MFGLIDRINFGVEVREANGKAEVRNDGVGFSNFDSETRMNVS